MRMIGTMKDSILVTNDDGINAPGIQALIDTLVASNICDVWVCAPDQEKSAVAHSITTRDTVEVEAVEITGATAFEVTGTPADCVSLALTSHLFPSKPTMVISGINKGSNCGHHIIYSGTVGGAREAYMNGIPSIALSLDWERGVSREADFDVGARACMPLIQSALESIREGVFPEGCFLNVDIPRQPQDSKGFKLTRQGTARITPHWVLVTKKRSGARMAGAVAMLGMTGAGPSLASLGTAATSGLERGADSESADHEEDVKPTIGRRLRYENRMGGYDHGEEGEDVDNNALLDGWITVTPLGLQTQASPEVVESARQWLGKL